MSATVLVVDDEPEIVDFVTRYLIRDGYQVVVASDASATRSITRANGESVEHAALHNAALAEIEDTFGDVLTTAQITQLALR